MRFPPMPGRAGIDWCLNWPEGEQPLRAERPIVIFDRKPKDLRMQNNVVGLGSKAMRCARWLSARSITGPQRGGV